MTTPSEKIVLCICGDPQCAIPLGYCHCGCGNKALVSPRDSKLRGSIKGQPFRFIAGHQGFRRRPIETGPTFKIDGVYCRLIPLGNGLYATVDATDYEWLMRWTWSARWDKHVRSFYVNRTARKTEAGNHGTIQMHRQILGLENGDPRQADHVVSGNTFDNRRKNLRIAQPCENSRNMRRHAHHSTGFKGVSERGGRYRAHIRIDGTLRHLGWRATPEEAHELYCSAAAEEFKCFANDGNNFCPV